MPRQRKTSRRQFLQGHSAVEAIESVLPAAEAATSDGGDSYLIEISRRAMACEFQVLLNADQRPQATESALQALDLVSAVEDQLSVYREHSLVSRLNRRAAAEPQAVEVRLFHLLELCVQLFRETNGAFDITAGPLWQLWGFHRRAGQYPPSPQVQEARQQVGSQHLNLDAARQTLGFARPGIQLNLGSIGKGFALDRCADLLTTAGVRDFMIHGGQSSILARGSRRRGSGPSRGWSVAVKHPSRPEKRLGVLWLREAALGTSGDANQFFYYRGQRYGHIIDPRSGYPAQGMLSSTVVAADAARADALATAFFVMGKQAVIEYCRQHEEIGAVLVTAGPRAGSIAIDAINLDEDVWQPD